MSFIKKQIATIKKNDPAIHSNLEIILYPSFRAMLYYKLSHFFFRHKRYFLARYVSELGKRRTGIEIHPGAIVSDDVFIDHGMGVVIGETAIVGSNVVIYHGVTLGGTGKDTGKRHPTIGDNVMIGAGTKILGNIKIGNNVKIGANAVVLKDIMNDTTYVGIPKQKITNHLEND